MKASFKSDAISVKNSTIKLETILSGLQNEPFKKEIKQSNELESTVKLIEKLSILNEYKLNLFKDFSSYQIKKK